MALIRSWKILNCVVNPETHKDSGMYSTKVKVIRKHNYSCVQPNPISLFDFTISTYDMSNGMEFVGCCL